MRINPILSLLFIFALISCKITEIVAPADCNKPALTDIAQCLAVNLTKQVSPQEAEGYLIDWGYNGDVISADIIPDSSTTELVIAVRAGSQPYDPQGKLIVLEYKQNQWDVAFESPDPQADLISPEADGLNTLTGNWWFELSQVTNLQGNPGDDLLFLQRWSNITSTFESYPKLMTFVDGEIRILPIEDRFIDHEPIYIVDPPYIYSQSRLSHKGVAITRTLTLKDGRFEQIEQKAHPAAAKLSITMEDGTQFISFDEDYRSFGYGLFRIQGDEQFHYDVPFYIRRLEKLHDGNVYIGGSDIFQVDGDVLQPVTNMFAPLNIDLSDSAPVQVLDIEMTSNGEIWVAGGLHLLHYGHDQSNHYSIYVVSITLAPDDSVWALGWDGIADSNCCIFHVDGKSVTTYQQDDKLPVSADLAQKILAEAD